MDTVTSRLLSSTNFWSMWKMGLHAGMWSKMTHKSSFISSLVLAEKDELLFFPSHSHVYLSVIRALEQRLLMPSLWYMTHRTVQLFIQWINPKKKMQTWLTSAPRLFHNSFVFMNPQPPSSPLDLIYMHSPQPNIEQTRQRALWVLNFGGKLFMWPRHISALQNLLRVIISLLAVFLIQYIEAGTVEYYIIYCIYCITLHYT